MNEQEKLQADIENINDLHEKDEAELYQVISAFSPEGIALRSLRKKVRYQLYRLQSQKLGKSSADDVVEEGLVEKIEKDPNFGGWRFFGMTWDVALDDPYRCVHRDKSVREEWDELVAAKFPRIESDGRVVYPDITVKKAVEKEIESKGHTSEVGT